ncbi:MFS transporter [Streptomyces uncialis]|uniref:MFS transporter n=1 Tax=Streptomyces uncialis TaxID=1048205 RepID=UPI003869CDEB|nr:MFS transporter [Streptomyces uncialis]
MTAPVKRRRAPLLVLCGVHFMLVLDDTVVSVALPTLRAELGFGTGGLTWVANAYLLAYGGLLMPAGRAGDLYGRRRVFLLGVALFGVASLGCGLAQEPWQLVAGRFAQGAGAALAGPGALALLTLLYPGDGERARALGLWGGLAALGGTTGLVVSGALTGLASWRWIFLVNLPVVLVTLFLVPRLVDESRAPRAPRLDIPGAVLGTGAVTALVYGLIRAGDAGWGSTAVTVPLLLSAVLAGVFVVVERRAVAPLVPRGFLADRVRAVSNGTGLLFTAVFFALSFLLMLRLQTALGYGPLRAGLAFVPYGLAILAGVWLSSRAVVRIGVRRTLVSAFLVGAVGLLTLAQVSPGDGYASGVLPGILLAALGSGLGAPALAVGGVSGTTEDDAGVGSAVLGSVQQVGGAIGIAGLVTLAVRQDPGGGHGAAALDGYASALYVAAGVMVLGAVLVHSLLPAVPGTRAAPESAGTR